MAKIQLDGKNMILAVSYDLGSTYEVLGCSSGYDLSVSQGSLQAACKEDGKYVSSIAGDIDWSISVSGFKAIDESGNNTFDKFFVAADAETPVMIKVYRRSTADINAPFATSKVYTGEVIIESLSESANKGAVVSGSFTLKGSGKLTVVNASAHTACVVTATGASGVYNATTGINYPIVNNTATISLRDTIVNNLIAYSATTVGRASVTGGDLAETILLA